MSEVKIYTVVSDELSSPVIGELFCTDMVRHSDYAALERQNADLVGQLANAESKCRELAAESSNKSRCLGFFASVIKSGEEWTSVCEHEYSEAFKTPATDAFLAEVLASELDSLAGVAETMLVKFSNQRCSQDMHEVVGWKMVLQQASNRAAQLRKGSAL